VREPFEYLDLLHTPGAELGAKNFDLLRCNCLMVNSAVNSCGWPRYATYRIIILEYVIPLYIYIILYIKIYAPQGASISTKIAESSQTYTLFPHIHAQHETAVRIATVLQTWYPFSAADIRPCAPSSGLSRIALYLESFSPNGCNNANRAHDTLAYRSRMAQHDSRHPGKQTRTNSDIAPASRSSKLQRSPGAPAAS
jgi:hypothetical protein